MSKKFIISVIICLLCAACAFGLTACGDKNSVKGNTYVYESFALEFAADAGQEAKDEWNARKEEIEAAYKGLTMTFKKDGSFTLKFANGNAPDQWGIYNEKDGLNLTVKTAAEEGATNASELNAAVDKDVLTLRQAIGGETAVNGVTVVITLKLAEE